MSWDLEKQRAANRGHYRNNKQYYIDKAQARRRELRVRFRAYKATLKCSRCPESDPVCLDFHHQDGKEMAVTNAMKAGWSWKRLMSEIAKCIVLCANCHRKEHWSRSSLDRTFASEAEGTGFDSPRDLHYA
jgi:hypothetical protein